MEIQHRKIFITGAALGLGREISKILATRPCELDLLDIRTEELKNLKQEIETSANRINLHTVDLSDRTAVKSLIESEIRNKDFDLFIFNAAVVHGGSFLESSTEAHRKLFEVNYFSVADFLQSIISNIKPNSRIRIVVIASIASFLGFPYAATYGASKWALFGLVEAIKAELEDQKLNHVQISLICPSYIGTGMFDGARPPKILPFIDPKKLAQEIVHNLRTGKEILFYPKFLKILPFFRGLMSYSLWKNFLKFLRVQDGMKTWKGRS